jgi:hypothetical protein
MCYVKNNNIAQGKGTYIPEYRVFARCVRNYIVNRTFYVRVHPKLNYAV